MSAWIHGTTARKPSQPTGRPGYRQALIETSIAANAALAAHWARRQFPRAGGDGVRTAYGVYLIETREIWSPSRAGEPSPGLVEPPENAAGLADLYAAIVRSERIARLLGV
jgi:carbonic anhydrase